MFSQVYDQGICRTVQLNIPWPEIKKLEEAKRLMPSLEFVIQLSGGAMDGLNPEEIAKKTKKYDELANYVLIDPSGGKGQEFDLEKSLQIYEKLRLALPASIIGFAGGFTGNNVLERTKILVDRMDHNRFCIDAEGGLRDNITTDYGDDLLNFQKVRSYIEQASKVLV